MPHLFPARIWSWRVALPLSLAFAIFIHSASVKAAPVDQAAPVAGQAPPAAGQAPPAAATPVTTQIIFGQGLVRDPDGKPVAGASVTALSLDKKDNPLPAPLVKTDAAGHYTIQAEMPSNLMDQLRAALKGQAQDTYLVVIVHAPGYAIAQQIIKGGLHQDAVPTAELKLARGLNVTQRVVDQKGKPLAGVTVKATDVQLESKDANDPNGAVWLEALHENSPLRRVLQATTGVDGLVTLHDVPVGKVRIDISSPTFISQNQQITVGAEPVAADKVPTITMERGAALSGRVLYPDGKPVAGVEVTASQVTGDEAAEGATTFGPTATTKPDGTYKFESIAAGKVVISVASPSPEWVGTRLPPQELPAGVETKTNITLSHGVLLAGYVRENGTKAPLEGVPVYAQQGDQSVSGTTDAKGRYQIRVQPGTYRFWIDNENAPDFLPNWDNQPQLTVDAQSKVAPDFLLQRGGTLTGTAKDEKGQPAVGVTISVQNNGPTKEAKVDDKGNWTLHGIDATQDYTGKGKGIVEIAVTGNWSLQGNAFVTVPAPPATAPPLALTLKPITLQNARVKVVTAQGQPVVGATVTYQVFLSSEGNSWQNNTATTNEQGEALLEGLRPEKDSEVTAKKDNYALRQKGRVARGEDGTFKAAQNVIMEALDARVSGRVLDAIGQPAVGARVACLYPNDLRDLPDTSALTDAQGQFTLQGLPHGELVIGVAKGHAFGQGKVQDNGTLELKLGTGAPVPVPQDSKAAFALLEKWIQEAGAGQGGRGGGNYELAAIATRLVPYDAERAQRLMTDAQGNLNEEFAAEAPIAWAYTDPKAALAWGKTLIPLIKDEDTRTDAQLQLAALTAGIDPAWARQVYDGLAQATTPTKFTEEFAQRYAELASLAGALKDPDAEAWRQALALTVNALSQEDGDSDVGDVLSALAMGDLPAARKWATQFPPFLQVTILGELITWGTQHNLPAAQQMLADLSALIHRPDFPIPKPRAPDEDYEITPNDTLDSATNQVLQALLDRNPRAAKAFLDKSPADQSYVETVKTEIVARAAGAGDEDKIKAALKTAQENYNSPAGTMAFIASLVSETLPQVSAQAFKDARDKLANRYDDAQGGESAAVYANARAYFAPEESRLLIESDWLRITSEMRKAKAEKQEGSNWMQMQKLRLLIKAMIPLNIERANEMLKEAMPLNDQMSYYSRALRQRMINWLLADAQTRRFMPLQRDTNGEDD